MLHAAKDNERKGHLLHELYDRALEQRHGKHKTVDLLAQYQLFERAHTAALVVRARDDEVVAFSVRRRFNAENGVVEKVYPKAKPDTNAEEILAYLKG